MIKTTSNLYSIAIAGTTARTVLVAETLNNHPDFTIPYIVTPSPKIIGRKKELTKNPLHIFAEKNNIPIVLVQKKLDTQFKTQLTNHNIPDFFMVVDFGYLVPQWLLDISKIAPLNIHPSALPRWRGSSPGQFALLNGEGKSAVTLMVMDKELDQGPIIHQEFFSVDPSWTQIEYYQHSFDLICKVLPKKISEFAKKISSGKTIETVAQKQPLISPTPVARRLTKKDGFVEWHELQSVMNNLNIESLPLKTTKKIEQMCRAFHPWPGLWTIIPTTKGDKRMKILKCHILQNKLVLDTVQIEGKNKTKWNEVKNTVTSK